MHALPIGHRRARHQAGTEQVRSKRGYHEGLVTGLTVSDGEGARRVRVKRDDSFEEAHLPLNDIEKLLTGRRRRREADEIDGVARLERVPYLALRLEAADAGTLSRPWIDDNDGTFPRIDDDARRRFDAGKKIVHRAGKRSAVHQYFMIEAQDSRQRSRGYLNLFVAPLPKQVKKENAALQRVEQVLRSGRQHICRGRSERQAIQFRREPMALSLSTLR